MVFLCILDNYSTSDQRVEEGFSVKVFTGAFKFSPML